VLSREPLAALREIAGDAYFEAAAEALEWLCEDTGSEELR